MYQLDYRKYAEISREAAAEACVLLKNDNHVLPIPESEKISLFGRIQYETYYCGSGSGGLVNVPYVIDINMGIRKQREINPELEELYCEWIEANPFDVGEGWAKEP